MAGSATGLVMDVRGLTPALRRPIIFAVVQKLLDADANDSVVVICDYEPAGLGYQLELRKETRSQFEFFYDQRFDGAWVALIRKKPA